MKTSLIRYKMEFQIFPDVPTVDDINERFELLLQQHGTFIDIEEVRRRLRYFYMCAALMLTAGENRKSLSVPHYLDHDVWHVLALDTDGYQALGPYVGKYIEKLQLLYFVDPCKFHKSFISQARSKDEVDIECIVKKAVKLEDWNVFLSHNPFTSRHNNDYIDMRIDNMCKLFKLVYNEELPNPVKLGIILGRPRAMKGDC